jgi:hypothetical protein
VEQHLTKLTVNLLPVSYRALEQAAAISEHRRTDVVNRALQLYFAVVKAAAELNSRQDIATAYRIDDFIGDGDTYEVRVRRVDGTASA